MVVRVKKLISILLITAFILPLIPAVSIFANLQNHVFNVKIRDVPVTAGYNAMLTFDYVTSINSDTRSDFWYSLSGDTSSPANYPNDARYDVLMRNVSSGQTTDTVISADDMLLPNTNRRTDIFNRSVSLSNYGAVDGSLYSLKISPYHDHWYRRVTNDGTPYAVNEKVGMDSTHPQEEVLYMTDIRVDGSGRGNKLTVTWDNPTYNGRNIFTGYRIHYALGGEAISRDVLQNSSQVVTVFINEAQAVTDTTRPNIRRLTYTITDDSLVPSGTYAVSVEPFVTLKTDKNSINNTDELRYMIKESISQNPVKPSPKVEVAANRQLEIATSDREYRSNQVKVSFPLDVYVHDLDTLKLVWPEINTSTMGDIEKIVILSNTEPVFTDGMPPIGTFYAPNATGVTSYMVTKPPEGQTMYYRVLVYVKGQPYDPMRSDIAVYRPDEVTVTPNRPEVVADGKIDVSWSAFVRPPLNNSEKLQLQPDGTYIDKNVLYDIWITDDPANLNLAALPKMLSDRRADSVLAITLPNGTPGYTYSFTQYVRRDDTTGSFVTTDIRDNKMYYIKVVAKKIVNLEILDTVMELTSEPAIISYFVPPDTEMATPQAVSKPPLRLKDIAQTSMTIEWKTNWYEIYDPASDKWYTDVAVVNGQLVYGPNITPEMDSGRVQFFGLGSKADVLRAFPSGLVSEDNIRKIDMGNCAYQAKVFPFSQLAGIADYKKYLDDMTSAIWQEGSGGWHTISTSPDPDKADFLNSLLVNGANFQIAPNTAYVILFRGYRTLADGTRVGYPSYLVATTLPTETSVTVDPTVPVLRLDSHTDTTATVYWLNQSMIEYELSYSDVFLEDPSRGTIISRQDIANGSVIKPVNGESCLFFTVEDLFPATGYYMWLRAIGSTTSDWSNPVFVITDDINAPRPPDGLGLAATDYLAYINNDRDTTYTPKGPDYLIISWLQDANDLSEISTALTGSPNAESLTAEEIIGSYIVMFNQLMVNKPYYIRAKTILTVTKPGEGLTKSYSYLVQLSTNSKFIDAIEIIIPPLEAEPENKRYFIRKESDFTATLIIRTGTSDGEYDSHVDPDMVPLPEQDFETIYDSVTDTLTYRFRAGAGDKYVEQRFISKLIQSKVFTYGVNLSKYNNQSVTNRIVEIPYQVFKTFSERKINFIVIAENMVVTFPPGCLETAAVKALPDYGVGSTVRIELSSAPGDLPELAMENDEYIESYVSTPQKLSVRVITPTRTASLDLLAKNVTVDLRLSNRYTAMDKNVGSYMSNKNTGGWERINAAYNTADATMSVSTDKANTTYSAIAADAPILSDINDDTADAVINVASRLHITDLRQYNATDIVGAMQFNNLVAAVAKGSMSVAMNEPMPDETFNSLGKSGLLASGMYVPREAGIASLVKLYETKTKAAIKQYTSLEDTPYEDIKTASAQYRTALLKAGDLGFYGPARAASPKDNMKLGELLYILDIIMQDAGM